MSCMLYFDTLKLPCRSKIKGRRCCPPQRAFDTASPLWAKAVLEAQSRMQKPNPYLLPRSEVCGHRAFRRAESGLTPASSFQPSFYQLNPLTFLAFYNILLHEADSAAILPFNLPYEANAAAILPFMLLYEADSDAMLPDFLLYRAIYAVILPF